MDALLRSRALRWGRLIATGSTLTAAGSAPTAPTATSTTLTAAWSALSLMRRANLL